MENVKENTTPMTTEVDDDDEVLDLSSQGSMLLQLDKGKNEELSNDFFTLDFFASVDNKSTGENMICFSVEEIKGKYFWASTSLYDFFANNVDKATEDTDARALYFRKNEVKIKYCGKTPLKNDPSRSCNVWKYQVNRITK